MCKIHTDTQSQRDTMTNRDSNGRFAPPPQTAHLTKAQRAKAIEAANKASATPDATLQATQADIALSLIERGLSPVAAAKARGADMAALLTDTPQSLDELYACLTGRCREASIALIDTLREDRAGQSGNFAKALARYEALSEVRAMVQNVIKTQAKDKRRRGLFARLFG